MSSRQDIIDTALKYVGIHEYHGNSGWDDLRFAELMADCGWQRGQAWCAYLTELVWKESMPEQFAQLDKLFSAGAVKTWNNFKDSGWPVGKDPQPGDVVIWQYWHEGSPTWKGHAGIVLRVEGNEVETVEGNTNTTGGREGDEVAIKRRMINFDARNGLVMRGFIHPKLEPNV